MDSPFRQSRVYTLKVVSCKIAFVCFRSPSNNAVCVLKIRDALDNVVFVEESSTKDKCVKYQNARYLLSFSWDQFYYFRPSGVASGGTRPGAQALGGASAHFLQ